MSKRINYSQDFGFTLDLYISRDWLVSHAIVCENYDINSQGHQHPGEGTVKGNYQGELSRGTVKGNCQGELSTVHLSLEHSGKSTNMTVLCSREHC